MKLKKWVQVVLEFIACISFVLFLGSDSESVIAFVVSHLIFAGMFILSSCLLEKYGR